MIPGILGTDTTMEQVRAWIIDQYQRMGSYRRYNPYDQMIHLQSYLDALVLLAGHLDNKLLGLVALKMRLDVRDSIDPPDWVRRLINVEPRNPEAGYQDELLTDPEKEDTTTDADRTPKQRNPGTGQRRDVA